MELVSSTLLKLKDIKSNNGQIKGLPKNPRFIRDDKFKKLVRSIEDNPEMLSLRELLVYPYNGQYIIIGGNMRYRAMKELKYTECPCKILPEDTTIEQLKAYTIKDNSGFGEWDFDMLANDWDLELLSDCAISIPNVDMSEVLKDMEDEEYGIDEEEDDDTPSFEDRMVKDVVYASDNIYEIPTLLLSEQAGQLELPLTPWGANSRLRQDVTTYHFYVDDYRFNKLFHDPTNLINSNCKAIVEPNCSLHDQTPIAYGIHQIYKKRWLSRYMQDLGVKVYVDLNVSHKFIEFNKMGVPKGYNAFFTRGLDGWMESLKSDLEIAREISGLDNPNLIVYGGGKQIEKFCRENNLLYVTDFINAKKL